MAFFSDRFGRYYLCLLTTSLFHPDWFRGVLLFPEDYFSSVNMCQLIYWKLILYMLSSLHLTLTRQFGNITSNGRQTLMQINLFQKNHMQNKTETLWTYTNLARLKTNPCGCSLEKQSDFFYENKK